MKLRIVKNRLEEYAIQDYVESYGCASAINAKWTMLNKNKYSSYSEAKAMADKLVAINDLEAAKNDWEVVTE